VVLKANFGLCGDVGWCEWVLGGLGWPFRGFSHTQPSKESLQENIEDIGDLQEVYRRMSREVFKVLRV